MTSEGFGEMFEGNSADKCAGKFLLVAIRAERSVSRAQTRVRGLPSALAEMFLFFFLVLLATIGNGGDVQDLDTEDGYLRTQVPLDEGGGTDPIQADVGAGGDVTECNRGGDAVHAPVDEQVAVSDDDMEGGAVKFPVEMGPGVAQDEEGGGDVPTRGPEKLYP